MRVYIPFKITLLRQRRNGFCMDIKIIFENKDFLIIDKSAGVLVHRITGQKAPEGLVLTDWLVEKYPEIENVGDSRSGQANLLRPGIVHRLDKDTSGLMIIAKNNEPFFYFKKLFKERKIKKKYLALVYGEVKNSKGVIEKPLGRKSGSVKQTTKQTAKDIKEAITRYKVLKIYRGSDFFCALLEVEPKTGRTHQIRAHLASIGHPVVGDQLYGRCKKIPKEFENLKRQFLHASFLEFLQMDGKGVIRFESDLPEELSDVLRSF